MADNCFVFFNSLTNVSDIKFDADINLSYEEALSKKNYMYSTTLFFQSFKEKTIDAKYFDPDAVEVNGIFTFYKKSPHQNYYNYLCTLDNGAFSFSDFNIANNEMYHYLAAVEVQSSTGSKYVIYQNKYDNGDTRYYKDNWEHWSICNVEESTEDGIYLQSGYVWKFLGAIENEDLTQNLSVTAWDTLGRYGKISKGNKNFTSGTLNCLLGNMEEYTLYKSDGQVKKDKVYQYTEKYDTTKFYARENEKYEKWLEFCNDGELKLLKDAKGNAWIVQIVDSPSNSINTQSNYRQTTVSFSWQEVENISEKSIIAIREVE